MPRAEQLSLEILSIQNINGTGIWISSKGYIWLKVPVEHPCNRAGEKGFAPLHLLMFWKHNGRLPKKGYHVHHQDENKMNNHPENLKERKSSTHGRIHLSSKRARELGRLGGKAAADRRRAQTDSDDDLSF